MAIKKNDFIELEFTGKITETGDIFDTTRKADAEKAGFETKELKPFILSVGHKMLPAGLDNDLEGKEENKEYTIELKPEQAFGKRNPQMIRMIPTKYFHEQKIEPQRGMQLALDGQLVKILSSSGGRTLVDFNNPLAGKRLTYNYKINKIITEQREKINALQDFLFKQRLDFDIKDKIITFKVTKELEPLVKLFSPKFEEILKTEIKTEIVEKTDEKIKEKNKE